jgi:hypothetical protein
MKCADAVDAASTRYQIKSRRISDNKSRQLSALRNLDMQGFDVLAAILFHRDYQVFRACLIPFELVKQHSKHSLHTNSGRFLLVDAIWQLEGVEDVTDALRVAADEFEVMPS